MVSIKNILQLTGAPSWRIIPVSKWLGSPPFTGHEWPFGRGPTTLLMDVSKAWEPILQVASQNPLKRFSWTIPNLVNNTLVKSAFFGLRFSFPIRNLGRGRNLFFFGQQETCQHNKYPNVFALGDCSSLPTSKCLGESLENVEMHEETAPV